jgi:ribosomal protein L11 methyltransferase
VVIDPGRAFGTGAHATTRLCLEFLQAVEPTSLLDVGCGSGVLAIAALKLGAGHAAGVDNDPQALIATRANAERNGVAQLLSVCAPEVFDSARPAHDFVIANILAGALVQLAPALCAAAADGAPIALSGILVGQETEVIAHYQPWCEALATRARDGWILVTARRRARSAEQEVGKKHGGDAT